MCIAASLEMWALGSHVVFRALSLSGAVGRLPLEEDPIALLECKREQSEQLDTVLLMAF